jgi:hypothetical protein
VWTLVRAGSFNASNADSFQGTAATDGGMLLVLGDPKTSNNSIASTWSFDGRGWQRHVVNEPAAGSYLVYDAAVSAFVAVGDSSNSSSLDVGVLQSLTDGWQILSH